MWITFIQYAGNGYVVLAGGGREGLYQLPKGIAVDSDGMRTWAITIAMRDGWAASPASVVCLGADEVW